MLGSSMAGFALTIWVWEQTGEATQLALVTLFAIVPSMLVSLFAGALVDRLNRKWLMIAGDTGTALSALLLLVLISSGDLQLWHLFLARVISGACSTLQSLAFQASLTTMLPKNQYARASGMMSLAQYSSVVGGPLLAGILLAPLGIAGILMIDLLTFLIAVTATALIRVPPPEPHTEEIPQHFWANISFGFRYIFARRPLLGLLVIVFLFNAFESLGYPLIAPMILARTGSDEAVLGTVNAVMGLAGVMGGLLISVWGGGKRKIHGLLIGVLLTGLLGDSLMGLGQGLILWLIAGVGLEFFIPLLISSHNAIWQVKVPAALQGRVFAARGLIYEASNPISMILAALLADRVFEPAMQPNGGLAPIFGGLVGTGEGAGYALLLIVCGVLCAVVAISGYTIRSIREVEVLMPDAVHESDGKSETHHELPHSPPPATA
jgi:MFS transporter, DHA3 family, macrolide efflux protein